MFHVIDSLRPLMAHPLRDGSGLEAPSLQAQSLRTECRIVAPADAAKAGLALSRPGAGAARPGTGLPGLADCPRPIDRVRDSYAAHRLACAVQAFKDEQARIRARGESAGDLGTIQGLAPLQPYRLAMGNPWIEPQALAVSASPAALRVPPVAGVDALRSGTDDAMGSDPASRTRRRSVGERP